MPSELDVRPWRLGYEGLPGEYRGRLLVPASLLVAPLPFARAHRFRWASGFGHRLLPEGQRRRVRVPLRRRWSKCARDKTVESNMGVRGWEWTDTNKLHTSSE